MVILRGDLIQMALDGQFDVFVHGCNCFHTMGRGIAKTVKQTFPEAYRADLKTDKGEREKLGQISIAPVVRDGLNPQIKLIVVNGYTQFDYRGPGPKVDYQAIRSVMRSVKQQFSGVRIGYPQIGAGLAGGDWGVIEKIIQEELDGENHTLVIYQPTAEPPQNFNLRTGPALAESSPAGAPLKRWSRNG